MYFHLGTAPEATKTENTYEDDNNR